MTKELMEDLTEIFEDRLSDILDKINDYETACDDIKEEISNVKIRKDELLSEEVFLEEHEEIDIYKIKVTDEIQYNVLKNDYERDIEFRSDITLNKYEKKLNDKEDYIRILEGNAIKVKAIMEVIDGMDKRGLFNNQD